MKNKNHLIYIQGEEEIEKHGLADAELDDLYVLCVVKKDKDGIALNFKKLEK